MERGRGGGCRLQGNLSKSDLLIIIDNVGCTATQMPGTGCRLRGIGLVSFLEVRTSRIGFPLFALLPFCLVALFY